MTTIKWNSSAAGSVLYAAGAVAQNQSLADNALERLLIAPVSDINSQLGMSDLDLGRFWHALVASGFHDGDDLARCEAVLTEIGCSPLSTDTMARTISGKLTDIRLAFNERFPKLAEQLPLRCRPLQTSWEECGRGMLREIGRTTLDQLLPKRVNLWMVQPVCGGGGQIDAAGTLGWMEALLTNADPAVPEVLRVAWLVARLGVSQGGANRMIDPQHVGSVAAVGLIPTVLSAGQALDLLPPGPLPLARAIELWQHSTNPRTLEVVTDWWGQLQDGGMPFPVAMKALDRMLFA